MAKVEYPSEVRSLVRELKRLPGVGLRSAERIAVYLLQNPKATPMDLSSALKDCHEIVKACATCGFFTGESGCAVCSEQGRDTQIICVVEQPTDVLPIERSGVFRGLYHCLGGKLSPLDDVRPEDLRIGDWSAGFVKNREPKSFWQRVLMLKVKRRQIICMRCLKVRDAE